MYEQKKKTNSLFVLICFRTKIFNDKLENSELQPAVDKHQFLYFHRSFPSSFNSHHPPIFSNWKSTTASTPSKGNVNTLKSYSNDLVSSLQSGLIACPKAEERDFYSLHFYLHPIRVPISFDYRISGTISNDPTIITLVEGYCWFQKKKNTYIYKNIRKN